MIQTHKLMIHTRTHMHTWMFRTREPSVNACPRAAFRSAVLSVTLLSPPLLLLPLPLPVPPLVVAVAVMVISTVVVPVPASRRCCNRRCRLCLCVFPGTVTVTALTGTLAARAVPVAMAKVMAGCATSSAVIWPHKRLE